MKKVILTGGAGFIGSNILKRLNVDGQDQIILVDNLENASKFQNLVGTRYVDFLPKDDFYVRLERGDFNTEAIGAIIHQGACSNTMEPNGNYMMRWNFQASKTLFSLAARKGVPFIYASSAAVYGVSEVCIEGPPNERPVNMYGYSKLAFDEYVRRHWQSCAGTVAGLRYFNVYGPGEAHKGRMASMAYQFAQQIQTSGVAKLFGAIDGYGAGEQVRDFVAVEDLVDLVIHLLTQNPVKAIVNAGSGVGSTWNQLAEAVIRSLGKGRIEYVEFPRDLVGRYQLKTLANLDQLRQIGYQKDMTSLEEGIGKYVGQLTEGRTLAMASSSVC